VLLQVRITHKATNGKNIVKKWRKQQHCKPTHTNDSDCLLVLHTACERPVQAQKEANNSHSVGADLDGKISENWRYEDLMQFSRVDIELFPPIHYHVNNEDELDEQGEKPKN
jgi:hypothetical protein